MLFKCDDIGFQLTLIFLGADVTFVLFSVEAYFDLCYNPPEKCPR